LEWTLVKTWYFELNTKQSWKSSSFVLFIVSYSKQAVHYIATLSKLQGPVVQKLIKSLTQG
jgi:hypothetical protein